MRDRLGAPIILTLALCACGVLPPPNPQPVVQDVGGCDGSCATLRRLMCDGWRGSEGDDGHWGTHDDVSCAQVCADVVAAGIPMPTDCIAAADSCEAADACMAGAT